MVAVTKFLFETGIFHRLLNLETRVQQRKVRTFSFSCSILQMENIISGVDTPVFDL